MKITQTPGLIIIPPNGWGAVEDNGISKEFQMINVILNT
jgi:hypothetical protein